MSFCFLYKKSYNNDVLLLNKKMMKENLKSVFINLFSVENLVVIWLTVLWGKFYQFLYVLFYHLFLSQNVLISDSSQIFNIQLNSLTIFLIIFSLTLFIISQVLLYYKRKKLNFYNLIICIFFYGFVIYKYFYMLWCMNPNWIFWTLCSL